MNRSYRAGAPSYYPSTEASAPVDPGEYERSRAPLAIAASVGVMMLGAGFLAYTTSLPPFETPTTPAEDQRVVIKLDPAGEQAPAEIAQTKPLEPTVEGLAEDTAPAASPVDETALATAANSIVATEETGGLRAPSLKPANPSNAAEAVFVTRGVAPRLAPKRAEGAQLGALPKPADGAFLPSLKPTLAANSLTAPTVKRVITLGGDWLADERHAPAPVFFASDLSPERQREVQYAAAFDRDFEQEPKEIRVRLSKGETFVDALRRAGVRASDRNAAAYAFAKHQNLRALRPGQEFVLTTAQPNQTLFQLAAMDQEPEAHLLALEFRADSENRVLVKRDHTGAFEAEKAAVAITTRLASAEGRIDGSLYLSAKRAGAPDDVIAGLADMFAYDIDFQREIFGGDEFEAIFELHYDENGKVIGGGDILYGRLKWRGRSKEKGYYRFANKDGGKRADYFDRAGQSAKRLLMKTPIDGARLSSGFGTRRHPILGYAKAHKGVDFAARRGTPIKAAGDGVVERANRFGSFGNYIRIRHANGYKTAYAHLKGFRKGIRAGKRVDQGDIIGYVGTTGRSTGPHLHYEVHKNGKAVNPQRLKIATGVQLKGAELERFKAVRDEIDVMRAPDEDDAAGLLAKETTSTDSL